MSFTKKNTLRVFVILFIVIISIFIIDKFIGIVLFSVFSKDYCNSEGQVTRLIHEKDTRIIFFGNSRVLNLVDPRIITERLGKSAYNAALYGTSIFYSKIAEDILLKENTKAEFFILNVDFHFFFGKTGLGFAYPYIHQYPEILYSEIIQSSKDPFLKYKLFSQAYLFNGKLLNILLSPVSCKMCKICDYRSDRGFVPLKGKMGQTLHKHPNGIRVSTPVQHPVNPEELSKYEAFIQDAQKRGIRVILTSNPTFDFDVRYSSYRDHYLAILALAQKYNVPFLVVSGLTYPVFANSAFYWDPVHLNERGAKIYTNILADFLKSIIDKK